MTKRSPVSPAPGPLENYAVRFDDLFGARTQRQGLRRYLEKGSCSLPNATKHLPRPG